MFTSAITQSVILAFTLPVILAQAGIQGHWENFPGLEWPLFRHRVVTLYVTTVLLSGIQRVGNSLDARPKDRGHDEGLWGMTG